MNEFYTGQKVMLRKSDTKQVFEIVSWNDSLSRGRIETTDGDGRNVSGSEIVGISQEENESNWDWDEDEDEDEWE